MEKENIIENKIKSKEEETEIQTVNSKTNDKQPAAKSIVANALDQLLIVAGTSLLILLSDLVLKQFGYMFVRENGALILAGGIVYFVINCIYVPIMRKSKLENTIGTKILNLN